MPRSSTDDRPAARATLRLGFDCDNACVFCGQHEYAGRIEGDRRDLATLRENYAEVTFIGGEPALDARLPKAIASAHALGFAAIGVQTNARRLAAEPALFDALVEAGLTDLHLSIHGPTAEVHDYHTGRAGSFAACMEVIARAARVDLTVVVATVITRSNFRELPKLPPALKRRGVAAWLLELVRPYGRAADNFARVVPRVGMAVPWALHGLEQARRHALSAWINGAPLCALGPFAASALPLALEIDPRHYAGPCRECPARPRCPGLAPSYVEVFGSSELRPGPAQPQAEFDEGRRRLMRMFVGLGELVERPLQLRSPKPGELESRADEGGKNRRLPVLANDPAEQAKSSPSE